MHVSEDEPHQSLSRRGGRRRVVDVQKMDPMVEEAIRKSLSVWSEPPTGELTEADLEKVTSLSFDNRPWRTTFPITRDENGWMSPGREWVGGDQLTELPKDLEQCTQLEMLSLRDNLLTDVKGLEKLTQLTNLNLKFNKLTDMKGLEKLTRLEVLDLSCNKLTSVKDLEKLTQLTKLDLGGNQISDVSALKELTQLTELNLEDNQIIESDVKDLQKALPDCDISY